MNDQDRLPTIIQGGMGVGISGWRLARAVSSDGELGVVSGTALEVVLARRLQLGDPDGDVRRALAAFPAPAVADWIVDAYFVEGGRAPDEALAAVPRWTLEPARRLQELTVAANFVEVFLAKEGHDGLVGINLLEKVQLPNLASLFGAMLAQVDVVLMGAGIPRSIPGILDRLAAGEPAELKLDVAGALPGEEFHVRFDPRPYLPDGQRTLQRPRFLAIVSSATLAMTLARKSSGRVDGFVVEGSSAGGHNAPPRGALTLDPNGEPIYGPRDSPDLEQIRALGLPFWLGGSYGDAARLEQALALGAEGVQVGTAFAFCDESGMSTALKASVLSASRAGRIKVFTDPHASPTGFPFKVLQLDGTVSEPAICSGRERLCDLGYLRQCYREADGTVGYRCPGEPLEDFLRKGGDEADTVNRKCICNGLVSAVDVGQIRRGGALEPPLVTAGDDCAQIHRYLKPGRVSYSADDVLDALLGVPSSVV